MELDYIIKAIIFSTLVGFLLTLGGYIEYTIITPATFLAGEVFLAATIILANTPAAKGVALALFSGWLFVFFLNIEIPLPSPMQEIVYAVIFVPTFIGAGMTFLEFGKG